MALELMPDGETFKKLTKVQERALNRYYERQKPALVDVALPSLVGSGIPIIVGTAIGAIAYIFREQLGEEKDKFTGGVGQFINEGIWNSIVFPIVESTGFAQNPTTPENVLLNPDANPRDYRYAGPLTRCQRWETDLVDLEARGANGLSRAFILRRMADEGCSKPAFVDAGEWGRIKP